MRFESEPEYWADGDGVGHLRCVVKGFPSWAVEVDVLPAKTGPTVAETRIVPNQQLEVMLGTGTWRLGSKTGRGSDFDEPAPGESWSHLPDDIPPGGVPARLLRAINPGQLLDLARQMARQEAADDTARADMFEARDPAFAEYLRRTASGLAPLARVTHRPGRGGNGIDHYLTWAVRFADRVAQGSRSPVADLAAEFKDQGVDREYVRDTVNDARHRHGLLTKPGAGRVGGTLTEKALQLLAERDCN